MSKMSELDAVIRDLRTAAAALNQAAGTPQSMNMEQRRAPGAPRH